MRRTPNLRSANQLALALAEIERLKSITTRVTDGRQLVLIQGTDPGAGEVPPLATSKHVLYGQKHTRSFQVTAAEGVSLTARYQQGQAWVGGTFYSIVEGTLQMTDAATNYVYIDNAGVIASNTTSFPYDSTPLAEVVAAGGTITAVNDRRNYLTQGGWGGGTILGNPLIVGVNDTTHGEVWMYGDGAGSTDGGESRFYMAADHDAALEYWAIAAFEDDLQISASDGVVKLLIAASQIDVGVDGSAPALILHAQDGVDEGGELQLLGSAANADWTFDNYIGRARLHSGGSEYFSFRTTGLEVGPITAAALFAVGGPLVSNQKATFAGTVTDVGDHVFAIFFGAVSLDPGDTKNAYGLYGGGTVVATAGDTVANAYSMFAEAQAKSDVGAITNAYGLYIVAPTIGDVLNIALYNAGESILVGQAEWQGLLYKGSPVSGVDLSIKRASVGGALGGDDVLAHFEHTAIGGGTALGGFTVASVTGHTRSRPSGAGSVIGGEFIADVGANATAFTGDVRGVYGRANVFEAGGGKTIPKMYGVLGDIGKSSAGGGYTVADAYSGYFATPDATNIGTITNAWALFAEGTNALRGRTELGDSAYYLDFVGADPIIQFDGNDYLTYSRSGNEYIYRIGGAITMRGSAANFWPLYGVNANLLLKGDAGTSTLLMDAGDAIQYVRGTNIWNIQIASTNMLIIDSAGRISAPITGASAGLLVGGDCLWYRAGANIWSTPDIVSIDGQLRLPTAGSGAGLLIGGDVLLYRSAANVLTILDTAIIQQPILGTEVQRLETVATNDDPRESVYQHRAATTDASDTRVLTIPIAADTTYMITVYVTARRTGGAAGTADDGAGYIISGVYTTKAGVVTLMGAVDATLTREDQAAWVSTLVINGANVQVQVIGVVNNNITWHVTARVWQVGS